MCINSLTGVWIGKHGGENYHQYVWSVKMRMMREEEDEDILQNNVINRVSSLGAPGDFADCVPWPLGNSGPFLPSSEWLTSSEHRHPDPHP